MNCGYITEERLQEMMKFLFHNKTCDGCGLDQDQIKLIESLIAFYKIITEPEKYARP